MAVTISGAKATSNLTINAPAASAQFSEYFIGLITRQPLIISLISLMKKMITAKRGDSYEIVGGSGNDNLNSQYWENT